MKLKLTLAAGIIATLAAPVVPAHAVTGNWTQLATLYGASHYACRVPVDGGTTRKLSKAVHLGGPKGKSVRVRR